MCGSHIMWLGTLALFLGAPMAFIVSSSLLARWLSPAAFTLVCGWPYFAFGFIVLLEPLQLLLTMERYEPGARPLDPQTRGSTTERMFAGTWFSAVRGVTHLTSMWGAVCITVTILFTALQYAAYIDISSAAPSFPILLAAPSTNTSQSQSFGAETWRAVAALYWAVLFFVLVPVVVLRFGRGHLWRVLFFDPVPVRRAALQSRDTHLRSAIPNDRKEDMPRTNALEWGDRPRLPPLSAEQPGGFIGFDLKAVAHNYNIDFVRVGMAQYWVLPHGRPSRAAAMLCSAALACAAAYVWLELSGYTSERGSTWILGALLAGFVVIAILLPVSVRRASPTATFSVPPLSRFAHAVARTTDPVVVQALTQVRLPPKAAWGTQARAAALLFYVLALCYGPVLIANWMALLLHSPSAQLLAESRLVQVTALFGVVQLYVFLCDICAEQFTGPFLQARFVFIAQLCTFFQYVWIGLEPRDQDFFAAVLVFQLYRLLWIEDIFRTVWHGTCRLARWACCYRDQSLLRQAKAASTAKTRTRREKEGKEDKEDEEEDEEEEESEEAAEHRTAEFEGRRTHLLALLRYAYDLQIFNQDLLSELFAVLALPAMLWSQPWILRRQDYTTATNLPLRVLSLIAILAAFWAFAMLLFALRMEPLRRVLAHHSDVPPPKVNTVPAAAQQQQQPTEEGVTTARQLCDLMQRHLLEEGWSIDEVSVMMEAYRNQFPELFECLFVIEQSVLRHIWANFLRAMHFRMHALFYVSAATFVLVASMRVCAAQVPLSLAFLVCQ